MKSSLLCCCSRCSHPYWWKEELHRSLLRHDMQAVCFVAKDCVMSKKRIKSNPLGRTWLLQAWNTIFSLKNKPQPVYPSLNPSFAVPRNASAPLNYRLHCLSSVTWPPAPKLMRNLVFNEARALLWIVFSPAPKFNTRCYGYTTTATTQIWSKELKRNGNRVLTSRTARIALPCVRSDSLDRDNSGAESRLWINN